MSKYLELLSHPDELFATVQYKLGSRSRVPKSKNRTASLERCYQLLNMTSRSFAVVIQQLDPELGPAVCIFYLVLRGLDTIEDDMTIPKEKKVPLLLNFHSFLTQRGWTFTENGPNEKDRVLLLEFDKVIDEFLNLKPSYQEAIADITKQMGAGMSEFIEKKGVDTCAEWDLYCHYVAGLVGIGLSKLFSRSQLESPEVEKNEDLANGMGLFLQKTNIIRDYLEDLLDGRIFWPRQIWRQYTEQLKNFRNPISEQAALACLNELITNALDHVPQVFEFMRGLKNRSVFNFCAIPQVMAIATLARCFNNPEVFSGVVKIRRGESVKLIMEAQDMDGIARIFDRYLNEIIQKLPEVESHRLSIIKAIEKIHHHVKLSSSEKALVRVTRSPSLPPRSSVVRGFLVPTITLGVLTYLTLRNVFEIRSFSDLHRHLHVQYENHVQPLVRYVPEPVQNNWNLVQQYLNQFQLPQWPTVLPRLSFFTSGEAWQVIRSHRFFASSVSSN